MSEIDIQKFNEAIKLQPPQVINHLSEQVIQPGENCINRSEVKNKAIQLWNGGGDEDYKFSTLIDYITDLPPATPTFPTSEDCVSREQAVKAMTDWYIDMLKNGEGKDFINILDSLPPVTPAHGTCKECKYSSVHTISLDKIDEIRVCTIQFSKQVKDDYYCANYEKRGSEE